MDKEIQTAALGILESVKDLEIVDMALAINSALASFLLTITEDDIEAAVEGANEFHKDTIATIRSYRPETLQ